MKGVPALQVKHPPADRRVSCHHDRRNPGSARVWDVQLLPDGSYDAMVIDISAVVDAPGARLELALLDGGHEGDVVLIRSPGLDPDDVSILGAGARVTVVAGVPGVRLAGR